MMFSLLLLPVLLVTQVPEAEPLPPQIQFSVNEKVLAGILTAPYAKVNPPETPNAKQDIGRVFAMGAGVTPPVVVSSGQPDSGPQQMRKVERTGVVVVNVVVDTNGKVRNAHVVKSLSKDLDERALATIKNWVFKPATKDGQKVAVRVDIAVTFYTH